MKLKDWRVEKGMTQVQFADMAGVNQAIVSKWESGACLPDAENMRVIAARTDGAVMPNDFVLTDA